MQVRVRNQPCMCASSRPQHDTHHCQLRLECCEHGQRLVRPSPPHPAPPLFHCCSPVLSRALQSCKVIFEPAASFSASSAAASKPLYWRLRREGQTRRCTQPSRVVILQFCAVPAFWLAVLSFCLAVHSLQSRHSSIIAVPSVGADGVNHSAWINARV